MWGVGGCVVAGPGAGGRGAFPVGRRCRVGKVIAAAEPEAALAELSSIEFQCGVRVRTLEAPHFIRFGGRAIRGVVFISGDGEVRPGQDSKVVAGDVRFRPLQTVVMSEAVRTLSDPTNLRGK